jgi:hypothetical protein
LCKHQRSFVHHCGDGAPHDLPSEKLRCGRPLRTRQASMMRAVSGAGSLRPLSSA